MASFQTIIANGIGLFGPAPSNKWNSLNWGSFVWGEGNIDLATTVLKALAESLSLSDALSKTQGMVLTESLSLGSLISDVEVFNGGYNRLFPGGVVNGEDRVSSTWTADSQSSPTWTQTAASSTTWSAA